MCPMQLALSIVGRERDWHKRSGSGRHFKSLRSMASDWYSLARADQFLPWKGGIGPYLSWIGIECCDWYVRSFVIPPQPSTCDMIWLGSWSHDRLPLGSSIAIVRWSGRSVWRAWTCHCRRCKPIRGNDRVERRNPLHLWIHPSPDRSERRTMCGSRRSLYRPPLHRFRSLHVYRQWQQSDPSRMDMSLSMIHARFSCGWLNTTWKQTYIVQYIVNEDSSCRVARDSMGLVAQWDFCMWSPATFDSSTLIVACSKTKTYGLIPTVEYMVKEWSHFDLQPLLWSFRERL